MTRPPFVYIVLYISHEDTEYRYGRTMYYPNPISDADSFRDFVIVAKTDFEEKLSEDRGKKVEIPLDACVVSTFFRLESPDLEIEPLPEIPS